MKNVLFTGYYFDGWHGSVIHILEIAKDMFLASLRIALKKLINRIYFVNL